MYIWLCVSVCMYTCIKVPVKARRVLWRLRRMWTALCGYWEPNSGLCKSSELATFMSTWDKLESFWKRKPRLIKCHQISLWAILWCTILTGDWWMRQCHPWTSGPGNSKKAHWASPRKQASEQGSSWLLCQFLSAGSCPDFPGWLTVMWKCKQNTSSPPQAVFGNCVYHSNRNLRYSTHILNHLAISLNPERDILLKLINFTYLSQRKNKISFHLIRTENCTLPRCL